MWHEIKKPIQDRTEVYQMANLITVSTKAFYGAVNFSLLQTSLGANLQSAHIFDVYDVT